jgi:adenylosuccinate synthase
VPSTCVVGLQWGDEAKGKIVDWLCDRHDVVVRYQGGANAGHTVVADGVTYKLSLVPTGLLRPEIDCVIGNGVVIHPPALIKEIETLTAQGVKAEGRLFLSDRAHVILPYHIEEERLTEESVSAADHLGTTRRGIGPCYKDKVGRVHGVRIGDLYHPDRFAEHLGRIAAYKNRLLSAMLPDFVPIDASIVAREYLGYADRLRPYVRDTTAWLHGALGRGKRLLFEGAQGSLLDIDHGTYPYVTSSNSSAAGIAAGSGVPTRHIDRWLGIVKAYTTRVGGGPFPTEQDNEVGERIRRIGREYGTVTGRPRRCGWFDAVAVRHSARVSGSTEVAVMLLDVLSGLETLQVAVAYQDDHGRKVEDLPGHLADLERCRPVYETLSGWHEDITAARTWDDLPEAARRYVDFLEGQIGVPITIVSVGPDRRQTIARPVLGKLPAGLV